MRFKKFLCFGILLMFILSGCGTKTTPSATPAPDVETLTPATTHAANNTPAPTAGQPAHTAAPEQTQPADSVCFISAQGVRIRKQPNLESEVICVLSYGTKLTKSEDLQEWTKVVYNDITGYVYTDYLSAAAPQQKPPGLPDTLNNPKIVVKKSLRLLELWDGINLISDYPVGLGGAPEGHKQCEGDGKTPEGEYYVCTKNNHSNFYLSLGLSYPNTKDAQSALDDGRINKRTFDKIKNAIERKEKPSWRTPLGGEIMIHGHGSQSDWTAGCVAVDNEIMDILWRLCPLGTPVTILP